MWVVPGSYGETYAKTNNRTYKYIGETPSVTVTPIPTDTPKPPTGTPTGNVTPEPSVSVSPVPTDTDPTVTGTLDPADAVKSDADALRIPETVTANLNLPDEGAKGSAISWNSSHPDVIAADGTVTRGMTDITVTLTASVTFESASAEKPSG